MDFVRPLLMPLLVVMIVASVWVLGWSQSLDAQQERANRPAEPAAVYADIHSIDDAE